MTTRVEMPGGDGSGGTTSIVEQTSVQTIPSTGAAATRLVLDTVVIDQLAAWDAANNQFVVHVAGVYLLTASVRWQSSPNAERGLFIVGPTRVLTAVIGPASPSGGSTTAQSTITVAPLNVNDAVWAGVIQTAGGPLNTDVGDPGVPNFTASFLHTL